VKKTLSYKAKADAAAWKAPGKSVAKPKSDEKEKQRAEKAASWKAGATGKAEAYKAGGAKSPSRAKASSWASKPAAKKKTAKTAAAKKSAKKTAKRVSR